MELAERPSALLRRLARTSPLVTRAVVVAVASGLVVTAAIVVQAVSLATLLAGFFRARHAGLAHGPVWFAVATVVRAIAGALGGYATTRVAAPVRRDLRRRLTQLTLTRGVREAVDSSTQLATTGVEAIESYLAQYVPALVLAVAAPVVLLGWLALSDPLSAVIVAASVVLLPVFMILLGLEARAKMHERWTEQQRLADYFGDVVRGMTVLKSFNRSSDAVASLDEVGLALQRTTMATLRVAFLSGFALELLSSLATALVALVLGLRLMNGTLELNVALGVLLVTPEVFLPLRRSAAQFHASSNGIAAARALLERLDGESPSGDARPPIGAPQIVFDQIVVAASDADAATMIDVIVAPGSLTVLRGPSGVGKSTALRAVTGLASPRSGRIVVDGHDVADLDLAVWHRRLGWLPQDPVLVGRSVGEVVRMGDECITDERIGETLRQLELDLELDRPLGEGAPELSAGQRRRLALARCLVRNPDVLLLDEPTAHLDAPTAAVVERVISGLTMTRIVTSHREFSGDHIVELRMADVRG